MKVISPMLRLGQYGSDFTHGSVTHEQNQCLVKYKSDLTIVKYGSDFKWRNVFSFGFILPMDKITSIYNKALVSFCRGGVSSQEAESTKMEKCIFNLPRVLPWTGHKSTHVWGGPLPPPKEMKQIKY